MLDGFPDKSAYALCTFTLCWSPSEEPIVFVGKTDVSSFIFLLTFEGKNRSSKRS